MAKPLTLIVGLGNPGPDYDRTRHNAGAWLVEQLAANYHGQFKADKKCFGLTCQIDINGQACLLLLPTTFMNHSGRAINACCSYFKIPASQIIVAHDELDLPAGTIRIKRGGGHGGHNGLRDTFNQINDKNFRRIRVGIGHPGNAKHVLDYVLGRPSISDKNAIDDSISRCLLVMGDLVAGNTDKAMQSLHTGA